ncbi:MAG: hypothetical protein GWP10_22195 [Nitrospiraceae bacterium]|nr:hypothetical protein [Nitrospiraceae bacterium]
MDKTDFLLISLLVVLIIPPALGFLPWESQTLRLYAIFDTGYVLCFVWAFALMIVADKEENKVEEPSLEDVMGVDADEMGFWDFFGEYLFGSLFVAGIITAPFFFPYFCAHPYDSEGWVWEVFFFVFIIIAYIVSLLFLSLDQAEAHEKKKEGKI